MLKASVHITDADFAGGVQGAGFVDGRGSRGGKCRQQGNEESATGQHGDSPEKVQPVTARWVSAKRRE